MPAEKRRHDKVKGSNVIRGYRCEPELARRLTALAHSEFTDPEDGLADVAHAARFSLRTFLSLMPPRDEGRKMRVKTRGMVIDIDLHNAIERYNEIDKFSYVGTIRHVMRMSLGIDASESRARERRFAALSAARRGLNESIE